MSTNDRNEQVTPKYIDRFLGEYEFLSNFFIEPDGTCVEVEYQREKCLDREDRRLFYHGMGPAQAKIVGRKVRIHLDWDVLRIAVMYRLVLAKFQESPDLLWPLLDETEDAVLVEGNTWGDTFWGVCSGKGDNWLGEVLMAVRSVLRMGLVPLNTADAGTEMDMVRGNFTSTVKKGGRK